jgi:DNA-binding CsgD family transcriptional regulator
MRGSSNAPASPTIERPVLTTTTLAELTAELLRYLDSPGFLTALGDFFSAIVDFDNYIVYRFQERCKAELVHTNLDFSRLQSSMGQYIDGLHLVDPFYIAATNFRQRGLLRMEQIAPETFRESEYYKMFYKDVNVVDEVRFIFERNGAEQIHLFLERESPNPRFSDSEVQALRDIESLVNSLLERHWKWREMGASVNSESRAPLSFGLRKVIGSLHGGTLTAREIDIVELALKGHSAKSTAYELEISEGTVINHRRHVYEKLDIGSQAQLFHLFLKALYENSATSPNSLPT